MKKTALTLTLAFATITLCIAQQIEIKKVFGGYKYSQDGENLRMGKLVKIMKSNPQAFELIKKAQSNNTIAYIIGLTGGGLIGWQTGTNSAGGNANWTLAGVGAGLIAVGIPISLGVDKKKKQAVELYNSSLNSTTYNEFKPEFKIITNGKGIGLTMTF
ncbi:hypothetical protein [Mariniflexile sp.]|uniref:hypothetical protein n=1 Tax=Mariniflexile sp. TaxID=1979402 RepID=UPI004048E61A